jgi:hypothetical protein
VYRQMEPRIKCQKKFLQIHTKEVGYGIKLMGHNEVKTTLQYVEKVEATKDKAIDKMPKL